MPPQGPPPRPRRGAGARPWKREGGPGHAPGVPRGPARPAGRWCTGTAPRSRRRTPCSAACPRSAVVLCLCRVSPRPRPRPGPGSGAPGGMPRPPRSRSRPPGLAGRAHLGVLVVEGGVPAEVPALLDVLVVDLRPARPSARAPPRPPARRTQTSISALTTLSRPGVWAPQGVLEVSRSTKERAGTMTAGLALHCLLVPAFWIGVYCRPVCRQSSKPPPPSRGLGSPGCLGGRRRKGRGGGGHPVLRGLRWGQCRRRRFALLHQQGCFSPLASFLGKEGGRSQQDGGRT